MPIEDGLAWSARPYGCNSIREALQLAKKRKKLGIEDEDGGARIRRAERMIALLAERAAQRAKTPKFCQRGQHPLRTGRPGQTYQSVDFVTPIVDAIDFMHERSVHDVFGFFDLTVRIRSGPSDPVEKRTEERERASAAGETLAGGAHGKEAGWKCPCCANTDASLQTALKESIVCKCGFVVSTNALVSTHREKLGAEEAEDSTQHADRVFDKGFDRFDRPAATAAERRKQREVAGRVTNVAGRVKGLGRMCDAARLSDREAAKESRASDVKAGLALTVNEETRLFESLVHLEQMCVQLAPVDDVVARRVKTLTDQMYHLCIRHCRVCTELSSCDLRLKERNCIIIASSAFELVVERLIHGEDEIQGTTRQHLIDLQTRMQRSPIFSNASSLAQITTAKAMMSILISPGFDAEKRCVPCAPLAPPLAPSLARGAAAQGAARVPAQVSLSRSDSTTSGGASPPPSHATQLRDSVARVYIAHRSDMPTSVRDGANRAIQSPGFIEGCKAVEALEAHAMDAVAFCILNAVAREQSDACPSFSQSSNGINVPIAQKLGLAVADAEAAILAIRPLVPVDATSEASVAEDDLFS